jgi:predicted nucleic acid-binding protein
LLHRLYQAITITPQVYDEVVVLGAGLTGSTEVATCKWIEVKPVENVETLVSAQEEFSLGIGETSAIILAQEVNASLVLIDEIKARKVAREYGMAMLGCVGILQDAFGLHLLSDLTQAYRQLATSGAYIDRRILENSLIALNLPPM